MNTVAVQSTPVSLPGAVQAVPPGQSHAAHPGRRRRQGRPLPVVESRVEAASTYAVYHRLRDVAARKQVVRGRRGRVQIAAIMIQVGRADRPGVEALRLLG